MTIPEVGRFASIADPQGGGLAAFKPEGEVPVAGGRVRLGRAASRPTSRPRSGSTARSSAGRPARCRAKFGTYTLLKRDERCGRRRRHAQARPDMRLGRPPGSTYIGDGRRRRDRCAAPRSSAPRIERKPSTCRASDAWPSSPTRRRRLRHLQAEPVAPNPCRGLRGRPPSRPLDCSASCASASPASSSGSPASAAST